VACFLATAGVQSPHCRGLLAACFLGACLVLAAVLACACLVFWGAVEIVILIQSAVNSVQIGQAVSEAQEKPSVSFI
jgi:hypothetical protein